MTLPLHGKIRSIPGAIFWFKEFWSQLTLPPGTSNSGRTRRATRSERLLTKLLLLSRTAIVFVFFRLRCRFCPVPLHHSVSILYLGTECCQFVCRFISAYARVGSDVFYPDVCASPAGEPAGVSSRYSFLSPSAALRAHGWRSFVSFSGLSSRSLC